MQSFLERIPIALIYFRIVIGLLLLLFSLFFTHELYPKIAISVLAAGLTSDVFDGIIARKLNIATDKLRRLDSNADQIFYLSVTVATMVQCPDFFWEMRYWFLGLVLAEAGIYLISLLKFKREVATHTYGAKIWSLFLFAALAELMFKCHSGLLFSICFWLGLATRLEIATILFVLKKWKTDVPTLYHAIKYRNRKKVRVRIKKNPHR